MYNNIVSIEKLYNPNVLLFCDKTVYIIPPRLGTRLVSPVRGRDYSR